MKNLGFLQALTFWGVVLNNKPVIHVMNKLNKCRKEISISVFEFSILHTKLPHNKLFIVGLLNDLVNFCFDIGESKYLVSSYDAL